MITLTHELVEMMTDPEPHGDKGWDAGGLEAADAAESEKPVNLVRQTACLGGVWMEAYWSNSDGGTVIPIEDGYRAWLTRAHQRGYRATARYNRTREILPPDPGFSAACSKDFPVCCIKDKEYEWRLYSLSETGARGPSIQNVSWFPHISWSIDDNGSPIPLTDLAAPL